MTQEPPARRDRSLPIVFALGFVVGGIIALAAVALYRLEYSEKQVDVLDLPLPEIALPVLSAEEGASESVHEAFPGPALINFWATWCIPCETEHPVLMEIAAAGVPIYGILYHDEAEAAEEFLERRGSPFAKVLIDADGSSGVATGLTGIPETVVIDARGRIVGRWVGLLTASVWQQQLEPLYRAATDAEGAGQ